MVTDFCAVRSNLPAHQIVSRDLKSMKPCEHIPPRHRPNAVHANFPQVVGMIVDAGHKTVLDLPAGSGALTRLLLERGLNVVSSDLNPDGFLIPNHACVYADMNTTLPFEDNAFDAMVCIEGIEHIENPHLLAREANRILKKKGMLYISTPNTLSIKSRLSTLFRGYPVYFDFMRDVDPETGVERPIDHINPIGFLELRYVLTQYGFEVSQPQTNRLQKRHSIFYQLLRFCLLHRGRSVALKNPHIAAVRRMLLSDEVLFGECLILKAVKTRDG